MKLSIFPSVNPLPKGKDEKHEESKKAKFCEVREANSDGELVQLVTSYAWSPFLFEGNRRLMDNFMSCDFLVYDIDEGMTIDQCSAIVEREGLCCLCLPSPSHTEEAPRFRVIFPLGRTITSAAVFQETWLKGAELLGVVDEQCKDLARYFFSCTQNDGFWIEGKLFEPCIPAPVVKTVQSENFGATIEVGEDIDELVQSIYGEKRTKIPEAVDFFIRNAGTGLQGKWTNSLNAFVFSLTLSGVDDSIIYEVCEKLAPEKLDSKDLYQIKRSIRDGKKAI